MWVMRAVIAMIVVIAFAIESNRQKKKGSTGWPLVLIIIGFIWAGAYWLVSLLG